MPVIIIEKEKSGNVANQIVILPLLVCEVYTLFQEVEYMITKDMPITEVLQKHPETIPVFQKYRLGCIGCFAASGESLADGLSVHGLNVDEVIAELNGVAGN